MIRHAQMDTRPEGRQHHRLCLGLSNESAGRPNASVGATIQKTQFAEAKGAAGLQLWKRECSDGESSPPQIGVSVGGSGRFWLFSVLTQRVSHKRRLCRLCQNDIMDARECGRLNSFASIGRSDPAAMILALLRVLSSDARAYRLASAEQRACWQSQHLNARVPAFGQIRSIERERPRAFPASSCVLGGTVRTRLLSMTGSGIGDPP